MVERVDVARLRHRAGELTADQASLPHHLGEARERQAHAACVVVDGVVLAATARVPRVAGAQHVGAALERGHDVGRAGDRLPEAADVFAAHARQQHALEEGDERLAHLREGEGRRGEAREGEGRWGEAGKGRGGEGR